MLNIKDRNSNQEEKYVLLNHGISWDLRKKVRKSDMKSLWL
jgi:hypothetical protein